MGSALVRTSLYNCGPSPWSRDRSRSRSRRVCTCILQYRPKQSARHSIRSVAIGWYSSPLPVLGWDSGGPSSIRRAPANSHWYDLLLTIHRNLRIHGTGPRKTLSQRRQNSNQHYLRIHIDHKLHRPSFRRDCSLPTLSWSDNVWHSDMAFKDSPKVASIPACNRDHSLG